MKNFWFTFLALTFLFVSITDALVAQGFGEEACVITLKGQNRSRTVAGAVNKECGEGFHSAPWGNWGVDSNYRQQNGHGSVSRVEAPGRTFHEEAMEFLHHGKNRISGTTLRILQRL